MRKLPVLFVVATVVLAGCSMSLREHLVGIWKIDLATAQGPKVEELKTKGKWDRDAIEHLRFSFTDDGKLLLTASDPGSAGQLVGTWVLRGHDIIVTKPDLPNGKKQPALTYKIEDSGTRIHVPPAEDSPAVDLIQP